MDMMTMNLTDFKKIQGKINTVLVPIGMIEAHGPHCALGTDVLIPREFVRRLEESIGDKVLMAPEVTYGHSWGLAPFAGTIDISSEAFSAYVYDICKGFYHNGFEYIILFNGHGGNNSSLDIVTEKLADMGVKSLTVNWFIDYREDIKRIAPDPGHAGEDETSLVLAINENYAYTKGVGSHEIPLPKRFRFKDGGKALYPEGFSGNAEEATWEKGEQLYDLLVGKVLKDIERFWSL
ncbi:creatininase family protein [Aquibacillus koreensis]|uniref:Creatininase family protein n=1 Tax=Aquibacillus koreensis TaxID=279446 RepID=A0A9X3WHM8_9BACI|nr:creatininase family protein [Aquibacillus koreensis]MCT2537090.1 creatininase family protein [Aquibacillus koreensis]MDC3419927.1 creatininase family protein [Aquibacillus koreensis]